ncbi:MAG: glycoside hydrolase family 125 protein [Chloroherpetonaceae bacterium]|nr:glycoside hydrolase family 125 protein [Chloroherpetonaceae bacterium]
MISRRDFLQSLAKAAAAMALGQVMNHDLLAEGMHSIEHQAGNPIEGQEFVSKRPLPKDRKFRSESVDAVIEDIKRSDIDPELKWLFENCFPNTLDTTITFHGKRNGLPDTFIITGDIPAMWLRDSTAQVTPYIPLAKADSKLSTLIEGVIHRQTDCILIDAFANAFNIDGKEASRWHQDKTAMRNELHERKWEIDSLCYAIRLAYLYWKATGNSAFMTKPWKQAMKRIVDVFTEQQRKENEGTYRFKREFAAWYGDFIANDGLGLPTRKVGLIHSAFRPSDDACLFPFLIPSNFFAVTSLTQLAEMLQTDTTEKLLADRARGLASEISAALEIHSKKQHLTYGLCYAFETDGFGNHYFMDDGNLPSLISLPYLGAVPVTDPVYQNTRRFILSNDHMYFFKGKAGEGYGGPHAGWEMIWHLGVIAVALTSTSNEEIRKQLQILKSTHAGTGFMHEAFHKDDAKKFTRSWFAWANTLFGELILKLRSERPDLLKKV